MSNRTEGDSKVVEAGGLRWTKVETPKPWRPRDAGDVLVGEYVGTGTKHGFEGPYQVVIVRTTAGAFYISGTVVVSLFDAAGCHAGQLVRVVYKGEKESSVSEHMYRDFDLYLPAREEAEK